MSEATFVNDAPNLRPRKACVICHEKKIKCDYEPELGTCTFCRKNGLECTIPSGDASKPRKSIRATVEDLENRVQSLEGHQGPWSIMSRMPQPGIMSLASDSHRLPPETSEVAVGALSSTGTTSVPLARGATSPWSVLLSGTDGGNPDFQSFQASTSLTADSESSFVFSNSAIPYDMFMAVPGLNPSKIHEYARNHARIAPYPIIHWDHLKETIGSLIQHKLVMHIGQAASVWTYMAFGAAHRGETRSSTVAESQSGLYFQQAWGLLPQLLLDYDLWALKAVTLMVHYLQASAKPQACWAFLGTALRLAVSLGFDRNDSNLRIYSEIEMEEGRRAFWLCYIMEKSLCINLGHTSSFITTPKVPSPQPFVSLAATAENEILGENEQDAVIFYSVMIELTAVRDEMFAVLQSVQSVTRDSYEQVLSRLNTEGRNGRSKLKSMTATRDCIYSLAYFNTLQVLATTQRQLWGGEYPDEAVISARMSLDLMSESQKSGQLMCLWMWLYYAFTSAVILFLHSISKPLDRDTTLNLAAIADLEDFCSRVAEVSEGAAQCVDIAKAMRGVIHKTVKVSGRKRSREAGDVEESDSNKRRVQPEALSLSHVEETSLSMRSQSMGADANAMLADAPVSFAWDDWDKWLEDVDFAAYNAP